MISSATPFLGKSGPDLEAVSTSKIPNFTTLDRLAASGSDSTAIVESVDGDSALHRRLLEAGFTAGSAVRFVMATPFGDPLVFALRGASIALRKTEARCVRVRLSSGPAL
jgi:ferrous iron transport protein A